MSTTPRTSITSASSTSSTTQTQRTENNQSQFDVWTLIRRRSIEIPFCMEAKFRAGKRLHRIKNTLVTRKRKHTDSEMEADDEASSTSSTDSSDDWLNGEEEDDDLFDIFERLNVNNKKLDLKSLATLLISQQKQHAHQTAKKQRPTSGDMFALEELTFTGSKSQKLYLKKCADFQITPSSHFVKSLGSREIDLEHHNIGPKGVEACAFALAKASTIQTINLGDTGMGPRGAKYIAYMLRENEKIRDLNLSNNNIGVKGAEYLVNVIIDVDKLYRLDLSGNNFLEQDAEVIKLLLEEARNLKYLNLSHNEFREIGGELIGEALNWNDGLEELDLSWNHFRRRGSIGIAEGLQDNSSLRILNLSWNGFYLEGCRALVRTLQLNTTLEVLDLSNNRINRECLGHLIKGLAKNRTLHTLILKFNPLTSDGAYDILKFIFECPSSGIKLLDLGVQQVDPEFVTLCKEFLIQKRPLEVIYGQVIGHSLFNFDEIEKKILEENPCIVLIEFGKLMGFRLLDLFSTLDKDGSRTLDRHEIERGLRMANIPISDHCMDVLIEKLDKNGDGEIDFAELIQAQQEYRKLHGKLIQAQEGQGETKLEETPLWRIKTMLLKLMAEKMSDYPSFQRASMMLVKQIRAINEVKDAQDDAQAKVRASMPRMVKSRPTSSVKPSPVDIFILSSSSPEHSDDDVILTPELTGNIDEERTVVGNREHPNLLRRNFSVQLPLTDMERFLGRKINNNHSRAQEDVAQGANDTAQLCNETIVKSVTANANTQTKEADTEMKPIKEKRAISKRRNDDKKYNSEKMKIKNTYGKSQTQERSRGVQYPAGSRIPMDKGHYTRKEQAKSTKRKTSLVDKSSQEAVQIHTGTEVQDRSRLSVPQETSKLQLKATRHLSFEKEGPR